MGMGYKDTYFENGFFRLTAGIEDAFEVVSS